MGATIKPPRIAFFIVIRANFPELYRTACGMLRRGYFEPIIVFIGGENFAREYSLCEAAGLRYHTSPGTNSLQVPAEAEMPVEVNPRGIRQRLRNLPVVTPVLRYFYNWYVRCFVTRTAFICLPWHLAQLKKIGVEMRAILESVKPDVVVLPNVELGELLGSVAIEAKQLHIPTLIIPYTWMQIAEYLRINSGRPDHKVWRVSGLINRLVAKKYPQWCLQGYLRRAASEIVAMEWMGFPTENPWMADDVADCIALESDAMRDSFINDGGTASKCLVTGSATHDLLALHSATGNNKGHVLCFLPPDQTPHDLGGFEFRNYWEMLVFWIETLMSNEKMPVIFSLHPRIKPLTNLLTAQFPRINIHDADSCEVIPGAKFCVGIFGGSLRHAIASSKPAIHYDVFDYGLNKFEPVSSVVTVYTRATFKEAYRRLSTDQGYLADLEKKARMNAPEWGILDGHSVERIEAFIADKCLKPLNNARDSCNSVQ